jgi:heme/copper-type cytochrome/quinol oxidase subunit 2
MNYAVCQFFIGKQEVSMKRFLMILVATVVFSTTALQAQEVEPPVVTISATQLEFTPNPIALKRGQTVTLRVTSSDRIDGFRSKELGFNVDIRPGQPREITITPQKAGRFVATSGNTKLVVDVN